MLKVEIVNDYKRVIAEDDIKNGTVILQLKGIIKTVPNKYSLQLGHERHLYPTSEGNEKMHELVWPYLNHDCVPNAKIDLDKLRLIAVKDIKKNSEITFDYETTEWEMSNPFQCKCKSDKCRGLIKGKKVNDYNRQYA